MTTIEITDVASVRIVNPLGAKAVYVLKIHTVEKLANKYVIVDLFEELDTPIRNALENFTILISDIPKYRSRILHKLVFKVFELLNFPEQLSMELTSGEVEAAHFTFKDLLEAREFIHKRIVAEANPKITEDFVVSFGGTEIRMPSRGVSREAVKDELNKALSKFIGRPVTPEVIKLVEAVTKSIINRHTFSYGKRV